jgi:NADPH:quinone reductase-like Zn-dependent oxidoreductase
VLSCCRPSLRRCVLKPCRPRSRLQAKFPLTVLAVPVLSYTRAVITGRAEYPQAFPFVPGVSAIARVDAVGSDTTSLAPGQLVSFDPTIRARDDVSGARGTSILLGLHAGCSQEARKLAERAWCHGSWAEKLVVPLENLAPLNEELLIRQKGYSYAQLTWINALLVPYGGWLAGKVKPGETVIVSSRLAILGSAQSTSP